MARRLPTPQEVARVVEAYNNRYRDTDKDLWHRSQNVRRSLLAGQATYELEQFIWTVRSRWMVQGVSHETGSVAAQVLAQLPWDQAVLDETTLPDDNGEHAVTYVSAFVDKMKDRGVPRREFALAAKVLHWLLPWRVAAYDGNVRISLSIPDAVLPLDAYHTILHWELATARSLMVSGTDWIGPVEPRSPLRALDKYLWWEGGGKDSGAPADRRP